MSPLADDMGNEDGIMPPGHLVVPRMLASGNEVVSLRAAKESRQSPKAGRNGKQEMGQVTPEHVQGILINPFYAIQVAPELVETHEPSMQDEEWITGNSSLIEKIGVEQWLALLLDVLQGNTLHELVNPYHAMNIDPMFAIEHPPVWSKEQWIQANVKFLPELGSENWLRLLLDVLEGDFVTADDMGLATLPILERARYRFSQRKGKKRKKHRR